MSYDHRFLAQLLGDPSDDATRLVYADWLEEQGSPTADAKAEFLRLSVEMERNPGWKGERKARRQRLQQLAASLDTDWLAEVSRLPVENCRGKPTAEDPEQSHVLSFEYRCGRAWDQLQQTEDRSVRFCDDCSKQVHYCDTIMDAREHAWKGHCIAVDLGVIRRKEDLEPERMWLGRPSVKTLQQEKERMQPDAVSAERQRRKQEAKRE
jgi:uncharacterized protein (TIGR02996 family)